MRVGLVGCVKSKQALATAAKDLYTSPLFRGGRRAVEDTSDRWFILSARHGLVEPDAVIDPYDETLTTASRARRRAWSGDVLASLRDELGGLAGHTFEIHAGAAYYDHGLAEDLERAGASVVVPTRGLAMGEKLAYYASGAPPTKQVHAGGRSQRARRDPKVSTRVAAGDAAPPSGKYRPLYDHLKDLPVDRWDASFDEVEHVLGFSLPASARRHSAWWANEHGGGDSHARAWLAAGFQTSGVRLSADRVVFTRGPQ